MCRMLGVVSRRAERLPELVPSFAEFIALSQEHKDGWGMAWWENGGLALVKEPEAAFGSERFDRAVGETRLNFGILHFRLASVGERTYENTHPFAAGERAFCHNGSIDVGAFLGERLPNEAARGSTDSERYFYALARLLDEGRSAEEATRDVTEAVVGAGFRFSSLNFLLLTRDALYAYCRYHPDAENVRRDPEYYRLRLYTSKDLVVVASSGWREGDRWPSLGNGDLLRVDRQSLETSVVSLL